jgi:hypothetical protein
MNNEAEIENLKLQIRDVFIKVKNFKGMFRLTPKQNNEKIWDKAARLCLYFDLTPEELVGAVVDDCNKRNIVLMQHYLVGMHAEKLYREVANEKQLNRITDISAYVTNTLNFVAMLVRRSSDDIDYILNNPANGIEPWARVLLSSSTSIPELIWESWGELAKKQFSSIKGLKEELKKRGFNDKVLENAKH